MLVSNQHGWLQCLSLKPDYDWLLKKEGDILHI